MGGRHSRRKGATGEREFFKLSNELVKDLEWPYRDKEGRVFMRHPAPRHCEGQSDNDDPLGVLPVSLEIKRCETLSLPKWIEQVREQARAHQVPILAYRKNADDWTILAVMDAAEWQRYLTWKLNVRKDDATD